MCVYLYAECWMLDVLVGMVSRNQLHCHCVHSLLRKRRIQGNIQLLTVMHYRYSSSSQKEFLTNPYPSNIHIDPQQRCAVLNFYDNKLAVLPFRQADKLDERQGEGEDDEEAQ